jgi:Xaa-Pro aminopeptidase
VDPNKEMEEQYAAVTAAHAAAIAALVEGAPMSAAYAAAAQTLKVSLFFLQIYVSKVFIVSYLLNGIVIYQFAG